MPFLIIAALVAVAAVLADKGQRKTRRLLLRYLSGAPLDGKIHTNATFFKAPTVIKHPRGRVVPHRWHWRPGWHRALVRVSGPLLAAGVAAGLLLAAVPTLVILAAAAVATAVWAAWRAYRKVRRWWPSTSR